MLIVLFRDSETKYFLFLYLH